MVEQAYGVELDHEDAPRKDYAYDKMLPFYGSHFIRPRHDSNYSPEVLKRPGTTAKPVSNYQNLPRLAPSKAFLENKARLEARLNGTPTGERMVEPEDGPSTTAEDLVPQSIEAPVGSLSRSNSPDCDISTGQDRHRRSSRHRDGTRRRRHHHRHRSPKLEDEVTGNDLQVAIVPKHAEPVMVSPKEEEQQVQVITERIIEKHYYHTQPTPTPHVIIQNNTAMNVTAPKSKPQDGHNQEREEEHRRTSERLQRLEEEVNARRKRDEEDREAAKHRKLEEARHAEQKAKEREEENRRRQKPLRAERCEAEKRQRETDERQRALEEREREILKQKKDFEREKRHAAKDKAKEDKARKARERKEEASRRQEEEYKLQEQKLQDKELRKAREEAYRAKQKAEKDARENEKLQELLAKYKREYEKRKHLDAQNEAVVQKQMQAMGVCPASFKWYRCGRGWLCKGGWHYMEDWRVYLYDRHEDEIQEEIFPDHNGHWRQDD